MKLLYNTILFAGVLTAVASFTVPIPLQTRRVKVPQQAAFSSTSLMALQAPVENEKLHRVVATAGALALAALLWTADPAPLHEAHHPQTTFPTLVVSQAAPATTITKLQVTPTPGFGFGGMGISPFGVGPFGGFGGGVVIRNIPEAKQPSDVTDQKQQLTKEQQLEALVKQQRKLLDQYEKLDRLQQSRTRAKDVVSVNQ